MHKDSFVFSESFFITHRHFSGNGLTVIPNRIGLFFLSGTFIRVVREYAGKKGVFLSVDRMRKELTDRLALFSFHAWIYRKNYLVSSFLI